MGDKNIINNVSLSKEDKNIKLLEFEREFKYIPDNIEINKSSIYNYENDYLESEEQEEIIKYAKINIFIEAIESLANEIFGTSINSVEESNEIKIIAYPD